MIGFYLLAFSMALGLLSVPVAEVLLLERLHLKLALICIAGGAVILWSVIPRPDRFEPPGPRLLPAEHPKLFAAIEEVARLTEQEAPKEVYLVPDMNAFVAQRGGIMGFFSRRVMGLGLPLMQTLTVSQMKAVLAHEFGHFHAGDTKLGPWIYKTRGAIIRTVTNLAGAGSSVIHVPFEWYGNMFLKITQAISRSQEYAADALAAEVVGARHLVEGLKRVHGGALAFQAYWQQEYAPVLKAGYRTPIAAGFASCLKTDAFAKAIAESVEAELKSDESDPYDTHPPLRERIAALEPLEPSANEPTDESSAITLLADLEQAEKTLIDWLSDGAGLEALAWNQVVERVLLPSWRGAASSLEPHLKDGPLMEVAPDQAALVSLGRKLLQPQLTELAPDEFETLPSTLFSGVAAQGLGAAFCARLHENGWTLTAPPGEPVAATREQTRFEPFKVLGSLSSGELDEEGWRAECKKVGVDRLMPPSPPASDA